MENHPPNKGALNHTYADINPEGICFPQKHIDVSQASTFEVLAIGRGMSLVGMLL